MLLLLAASGTAQNMRPSQQLDVGLGEAVESAVASDGSWSAAMWNEITTGHVYVATSADNGVSWNPAVRVDVSVAPGLVNTGPEGLVIEGDVIYASWTDTTLAIAESDLNFAMSVDGGATWINRQLIGKGYPNGANSLMDWRMAVEGNVVAFMCSTENDNNGFREEGFVTVSLDGGITFGTAKAISTHPGTGTADVDEIDMCIEGGILHLVWQDDDNGTLVDDAYYSQYDPLADIFVRMDIRLNPLGSGKIKDEIGIDCSSTRLLCYYQEEDLAVANRHSLQAKVSVDGGASFGPSIEVTVTQPGVEDVDHPSGIVNSNGNLSIGFEHDRSGMDNMYVATSTDDGATWTDSNSLGTGGFPDLVGDGDYLALSWQSGNFPNDPQFTCSRDGGLNWSIALDASDGLSGDADTTLVAFNETYANFVVVWENDVSNDDQVFAGGARCQSVNTPDPVTIGGPFQALGTGFGTGDTGDEFMVLLSTAPGSIAVPGDGRLLGLAFTPLILTTAATPLLKGTIAADGSASTPLINFPPAFPPGTTLYYAALSHAGPIYHSITDAGSFTLQ